MKILIVRISSLGDLVHTIYAIEDLSKNVPDVEVHWLSEKAFKDIAGLHRYIKKVYQVELRELKKNIFSKQNWKNLYTLKKQLKAENYDLVIDSQGLLKSVFLAKFTKAPIYGYDKKIIREKLAALFYNKKFMLENNKNVIDKNREYFSKIFNYKIDKKNTQINLENLNIKKNLDLLSKSYNVIVPSSSTEKKDWSNQKWIELIKLIHDLDKKEIYLTYYSKEEYKRNLLLAEKFNFIKILPKQELKDLVSFIKNSNSVLGLDTGILHLANLLNIPSIGIYTGSIAQYTTINNRAWQRNIGGIKEDPSVEEIFNNWQEVVSIKNISKKDSYESIS